MEAGGQSEESVEESEEEKKSDDPAWNMDDVDE
jgi:hypothetical protein